MSAWDRLCELALAADAPAAPPQAATRVAAQMLRLLPAERPIDVLRRQRVLVAAVAKPRQVAG